MAYSLEPPANSVKPISIGRGSSPIAPLTGHPLLPLRDRFGAGADPVEAGPIMQVTGRLVVVDVVDGEVAEELVCAAVDQLELHVPLDVVGAAKGDGGVPDALDVLGGPNDTLEVLTR